MENPYLPYIATITKIRVESMVKDTRTYEVVFDHPQVWDRFKYKPGQFAQVSVLGVGEAPISVTSSPLDEGRLEFCIKKMGTVTSAIHALKVGSQIGVRGPYGNYFPIERMKGKNIIFIAGGIGLAPLRSLINYILHDKNRGDFKEVAILYGARTPGDLLFKYELEAWKKRKDLSYYETVDKGDEGWSGRVGLVPTVLKEISPSPDNAVALTCGPPVMIKYVLQALEEMNFAAQNVITTLEMKMKCGIGKCGRCNIGSVYVCKDGPVFTYEEIKRFPEEF